MCVCVCVCACVCVSSCNLGQFWRHRAIPWLCVCRWPVILTLTDLTVTVQHSQLTHFRGTCKTQQHSSHLTLTYVFCRLHSIMIFPSPWCNHSGWLGVKHQFTYLLTYNIPMGNLGHFPHDSPNLMARMWTHQTWRPECKLDGQNVNIPILMARTWIHQTWWPESEHARLMARMWIHQTWWPWLSVLCNQTWPGTNYWSILIYFAQQHKHASLPTFSILD